jgi:hypothetical protein
MSGGRITGNIYKTGNASPHTSYGAGVFLYDGTFSMSGSALITRENDVRLYDAKKSIVIDAALYGNQPVAMISLDDASYISGREVLRGAHANSSGHLFSLNRAGWHIVNGKLSDTPVPGIVGVTVSPSLVTVIRAAVNSLPRM